MINENSRNFFNENFEIPIVEEITLRDIPYNQQKEEIIEYCKLNERVLMSDVAYDLKLDLEDVYNIVNELIDEGILGVNDDHRL